MRAFAVYIILVGEEMATLFSDVCDRSFDSLLGSYYAGATPPVSLQATVLEMGIGPIAGRCGSHESGQSAYACARSIWFEPSVDMAHWRIHRGDA